MTLRDNSARHLNPAIIRRVLPDITDLRLYSPAKLGLFVFLDAVTLPLVCWFARRVVSPMVQAGLESSLWIRFSILPIAMLLLLVLAYWIPSRSMASDRMENTLLIGVLVVGVVATLGWAFVVFRDFRKAWEDHNGMAKRVVVFEQEQRKQQEQQAQREKQQREHYEKQLREKEQQAQTEHNGNEGSSNNQASKVFLRRHRAL